MDSEHPVARAIMPLKQEAMARAEKAARATIERVRKALEDNNWDLDKAAPKPTPNLSHALQRRLKTDRLIFNRLTNWVNDTYSVDLPLIVKMSHELELEYITEARQTAADQYDRFIIKLIGKIGPATDAVLDGNHIWSISYLEVTKPDGSKELWKTHMITNTSKLGKIFNQWPSRKVKYRT